MVAGTERPEALIAREALRGNRFGHLRWVAKTGSTNEDLLRACRSGIQEQVLVADFQNSGRGRRDRTWTAPPRSSLLMSVVVRARADLEPFWHVGALALAACQAGEGLIDKPMQLKWPNDVLIDGAKVAGVLAHAEASAFVIGIGLNVNWPERLPADLAASATSLNHHVRGREVGDRRTIHLDRTPIAVGIVERFAEIIESPRSELVESWTQRCDTIGSGVRVEMADGRTLLGEAVGVESDGTLRVASQTGEQLVSVGDVVHLRR